MTYISDLHDELLLMIFCYCEMYHPPMVFVCKKWRTLISPVMNNYYYMYSVSGDYELLKWMDDIGLDEFNIYDKKMILGFYARGSPPEERPKLMSYLKRMNICVDQKRMKLLVMYGDYDILNCYDEADHMPIRMADMTYDQYLWFYNNRGKKIGPGFLQTCLQNHTNPHCKNMLTHLSKEQPDVLNNNANNLAKYQISHVNGLIFMKRLGFHKPKLSMHQYSEINEVLQDWV
jgi:hypothetical protein